MGLLDRLEARARIENPSTPLTSETLLARFGGEETAAGVTVNERTVFGISPANACIRVLSETVGTLPCHVYERLEGGRRRATDHWLYPLLRMQPNSEINAQVFFEMAESHLSTWGNFYAEIQRTTGAGQIVALWPLTPDRVKPLRRKGRKIYLVKIPGESKPLTLPVDKVFHVWGLGYDGLQGYNPVYQARAALGLAKATEEYGSRYFKDGARFAGVLEHPSKLSPEAHNRLATSIEQDHSGLSKSHRLKILEEGMKYAQTSFPPEDSQFLETRRFQIAEVARFWRMPLHKIQELERATFSNIEHQDIEFVRDTIRPWLVRFEMAINTQLLSDTERQTLYAEFLLDSLLRGDTTTRHTAYASGIQNGYLTRNEVRQFENLNPVDGGDELLVPLNMVEAGADLPDDEGNAAPGADESRSATETRAERSVQARHRLLRAFRPLIEAAAARMVAGELSAARRLLQQVVNEIGAVDETFLAKLERFYRDDFPSLAERSLLAILVALARAVLVEIGEEVGTDVLTVAEAQRLAREHLERYVLHHVEGSQGQIASLLREANTSEESASSLLEARFDEWSETRAGKIALREATWAASSFAVAAYALVGVQLLRWNTFGESCPLCNMMNGRVAEITRTFIAKGQTIDPEDGQTAPLVVKRTIRHPPLHDGCDCDVSPA